MDEVKDQGKGVQEKDKYQRLPYEAPAIVYKGTLQVRAGSTPLGVSSFEDPASSLD
jgi:hypothetical protein